MEFLATPIVKQNVILQPNQSIIVELPEEMYKSISKVFAFRGALVIWQSTDPNYPNVPSVTFKGYFEPLVGLTTILEFNADELITLGQYASLPDNVFPVFMQGGGFYALKWSPNRPYLFKKLTVLMLNKNPVPIVVNTAIILYDVVYTSAMPYQAEESEINAIADYIIGGGNGKH